MMSTQLSHVRIYLNKITPNMEHLYDYIGENYPYLFPLSNLVVNESGVVYTATCGSQLGLKEFKTIGQTAASLGGVALLHAMNLSSKTFFLGEKIRIRKISHTPVEGDLKYCARAISFSKRKGKALLDIFDHQGQLAYTAELEYVIFDEESFQQVFSAFYTTEIPTEPTTAFEEVEVTLVDSAFFKVDIPAFTSDQYKGHFDHYPIVPGVLMMTRLLEGIEKFVQLQGVELQGKTLVLDSFETFLSAATPTQRALNSSVYYRQIMKDTYLFVCPIKDHKIEYGHYIFTVKLY